MTSIGRTAMAVLLMATSFAVGAHGPSGGGPDDPEASARLLRFDGESAKLRPLDERPMPWSTLFDSRGEFNKRDESTPRIVRRDDSRSNIAANGASERR